MEACHWSMTPVGCLLRPPSCIPPHQMLSIPRHTRHPIPHDSVTPVVLLEANTKPSARLIHNGDRSQADDDSASSRLPKQQLRLLPQLPRKLVTAMPFSVALSAIPLSVLSRCISVLFCFLLYFQLIPVIIGAGDLFPHLRTSYLTSACFESLPALLTSLSGISMTLSSDHIFSICRWTPLICL
jgi:hypothetical protein